MRPRNNVAGGEMRMEMGHHAGMMVLPGDGMGIFLTVSRLLFPVIDQP
jgi:hypothetical protein